MIDLDSFYKAATELFNNISEIDISSTRYTDSSIKILKNLNKKHRQNDLRNLKCLYKLWLNPEVRAELRRRFESNSVNHVETNVISDPLQNQSNQEATDGDVRSETNETDDSEESASIGQEEQIDQNILDDNGLVEEDVPEELILNPLDGRSVHFDIPQEEQIDKLGAHLQQNVNDQHNSSSNTYSDVHRVAPEQNQNSSEKIMHQSKSNQSSLEEKLNETAHSLAMKTAQWELVKAEMETLIMRKVERENELNLELTNIKKQLNESSLHSKTLECNIAELQTAYYNTSVEKDRYIEMISNLEQQLHDATSKFEFTEDQQVDLINRNIELVQQNDEFSKQLLESKNNNKEMTDQLSKVNSEFVAFKLSTQAEIELSDNIKLLEPQIVQLELTIHRKQKEIETIASSLRETKDEFEVQKSKAYSFSESTQAEIDSLQHKISEQIKTIRSLEDKIQQLTSSKDLLDNSKNELNHKTEEIKSKDSKIIQLSSTINALHIQIDANENDFKRLADEKETYTKLSITKDAEIKSMNLRLDAMKKTLQDKIKEISSVSDERSSLLSTKISLDEKIYCLQSQIKYFTDNFVDRTELNNLKEEFSIYEETKKGEIAELIKKLLQSEERLKNKCSSEELKLEEKKESKLLNICPPEVSFRCICGLFNDEGAKIQCSKCMVLQHMACVGTDGNGEYLCEVCDKRPVDLEIPLKKKSDEGYAYYLTLLRGDMQIRQFDTVYILRDVQVSANATEKHTYKSIGKIDYTECDIFRIEQLWKDPDGNRFVYGHHYLRPQETYHERYRKFYKNEIVRVPLYEVLPIDLIVARCWVLDPTTFSIGRPVNCEEEHVYICELRVDKNAKIFTKIRRKNPVCTEPFAFKSFGEKLKISRDFSPHLPSSSNSNQKRTHSDNFKSGTGSKGMDKKSRMNPMDQQN